MCVQHVVGVILVSKRRKVVIVLFLTSVCVAHAVDAILVSKRRKVVIVLHLTLVCAPACC